ncbi:MAG: serine/threonine-protein kinase [Myxococcota bacterium]
MLRKVAKYEIISEIGHGGMATVYRARDSRLERPVAIKVMHPHLQKAKEARVRFTREAKSVARLRHPNILEIYDNSDEDSDESYIVTELLTWPTLKEFAETHNQIPAEIAACFAIEIARALSSAHEAGIVHRDVKPENVLLHEDRCVKLTDFGIAQMVDSQSFTATGQILGSPGHMAPEQVEGGECDARTDVFSLGTVLYFLACGKLPFAGRNPHQVLRRIMEHDFVDPLRVRASIGGRLSAVIERCLEKAPADRYQSAAEVEEALTRFVAEVGIDDPSATLAAYLQDIEGQTVALRERAIEKLTKLGKAAADEGNVPLALDYFNRVLGLDEGNETVLGLIERVGKRNRTRTGMIVAGAILGVLGASALGYAAFADIGGPHGTISPEDPVLGDEDTGEDAGASAEAAVADAEVPDAHVPDARPDATSSQETPTISAAQRREPRVVQFRPSYNGVQISVNGGPLKGFGPSFHSKRLTPGPHTFRFVGVDNCCEEVSFSRVIPPGEGPFHVAATIRFRDARLYVESSPVNGEVQLDGRTVGRTRAIILVPMTAALETRLVTAIAPGYAPTRARVRLRAGQQTSSVITLTPAE